MVFTTNHNIARPVRLSETTRRFAWKSQQGKYGDEALGHNFVRVECDDFDKLSSLEKYDLYIKIIAEQAPIRICDGELVSGAATLGMAMAHALPAKCSEEIIPGVSHVTLGFDRVLQIGLNGIERELDNCVAAKGNSPFYTSLKNTITSFRTWHKRYLNAVDGVVRQNLERVPFEPPRNFHEAVQSLWFTFAFTRLCGNWPGIGRIDEMLGDYLIQDLQDGRLTLLQAREILAHFFIKGCEWITSTAPERYSGGDGQHYQNIILAGIDREGREVANEVTYLALDIIEELNISDFPVSVRLNEVTSELLLRRCAEVARHGGGIIAFYNEPLIIQALIRQGYTEAEARTFANDGCWEMQIPGKTWFQYIPFDLLKLLTDDTLGINGQLKSYDTFEALYDAFKATVRAAIGGLYDDYIVNLLPKEGDALPRRGPCSVVSLLTKPCIERGASYYDGGATYTVCSPHAGGTADVGNSLHAIWRLVYQEQKVSLCELLAIVQDDWAGYETLREYVANFTYYGNDCDQADAFTVQVLNDFADICASFHNRCGVLTPSGVSTFGRQIEWTAHRTATPFGRKRGEILSGNASPTPGTDKEGATAIIKSYCKADLTKQGSGAALDLQLHQSTVEGDNGIAVIIGLLRGFVALGGSFMQIDVPNIDLLRQAQENPAAYKTLAVRVSGWNARFVTLDKKWQQMIIERSGNCVS